MIDFRIPDRERFLGALSLPAESSGGIGTLNERSVHAVLKRYIEPDPAFWEVPVGRFVADIDDGEVICEIQTSKIYATAEKLRHFLEYSAVTLVTPQILSRHIVRVDAETGETLSRRLSPRRGRREDILGNLVPIASFIARPELSLWIPFLDVTDVRLAKEKGKRGEKTDTLPEALVDALYVEKPKDLLALLPSPLPASFTVKELALFAHLPPQTAQGAARLFYELGLFRREKEGRAFRYFPL
ncbi:MAG: hypothetical protein IKX85_06160 [Clostridia bacterium]|nr:hypothetical protein [Clostridia bacterium]